MLKILSQGWKKPVTDFNDSVENGIVYSTKGYAINGPISNDTYFTVWAVAWDSNNITQFASAYGSKIALYCRKLSNSGWSAWEDLFSTK